MKLTNKQIETLSIIREKKAIPRHDHKLHKNTMNALYFKGLVQLLRYANGEFWELTDKGLECFE